MRGSTAVSAAPTSPAATTTGTGAGRPMPASAAATRPAAASAAAMWPGGVGRSSASSCHSSCACQPSAGAATGHGCAAVHLLDARRGADGVIGQDVHPGGRDRAGDVLQLGERAHQFVAQLAQRAPGLGSAGRRGVTRAAQAPGQVAAQAGEGRQAHADPPGGGRRARLAHGIDARQRLVDHQRGGVQVGGLGDRAAVGLLRRHVGGGAPTSPVAVSTCMATR